MARKKDGFEDAKAVWRFLYICFLVVIGVRVYSQIGQQASGGSEVPIAIEQPAVAGSAAGVAMAEPEKPAAKLASVAVDEPKPIPKPAMVPAKPAPVAKPPVKSVDPVSGFHASEPTVIMLSTPGCAPCKMWEAANGAKFHALQVKYFSVDDIPQPSYPAFRIYDGRGRWHGRTGSRTTIAEIMTLIKG